MENHKHGQVLVIELCILWENMKKWQIVNRFEYESISRAFQKQNIMWGIALMRFTNMEGKKEKEIYQIVSYLQINLLFE